VIVRVNDMSLREQFTALGVFVIDPTSALVSLLDQSVRAPQASALLLHAEPEDEVVQVTITSPDVNGLLLRDLRLPLETLVLSLARNGHSVVPHGYTRLQLGDEVTLVGKAASLDEAVRRLGF
jgi:Trk K+ transport system NAD-binding subunit